MLDIIKLDCMKAVWKVNGKYEATTSGLVLTENPREVIAVKSYNKGELKIACATKHITFAPAAEQAFSLMTLGSPFLPEVMTFYCNKSATVPKEDDAGGFLSFFWLVKGTHYKKDSNLELIWEKVANADFEQDITVPIFTNMKRLNAGDSLLYHESSIAIDGDKVGKRMKHE